MLHRGKKRKDPIEGKLKEVSLNKREWINRGKLWTTLEVFQLKD